MECDTMNMSAQNRLAMWVQRVVVKWRSLRPRAPALDLEITSDYLKRDMGFMDGREVFYEEDARLR